MDILQRPIPYFLLTYMLLFVSAFPVHLKCLIGTPIHFLLTACKHQFTLVTDWSNIISLITRRCSTNRSIIIWVEFHRVVTSWMSSCCGSWNFCCRFLSSAATVVEWLKWPTSLRAREFYLATVGISNAGLIHNCRVWAKQPWSLQSGHLFPALVILLALYE